MGAAGANDFTIGEVTYWSDDRLQDKLDQHSRRVVRENLQMEGVWQGGGSALYYDYYWSLRDVEELSSGTAAWSVQNATGSVIATSAYEVNYPARKITFDADQAGEARYLSYTAYDVHYAAADVWDEKASYVAAAYDVKSDNHDLKRSQLRQAYEAQAAALRKKSYFAGKIRTGAARMYRGDMA
jgi:hypothetical protein